MSGNAQPEFKYDYTRKLTRQALQAIRTLMLCTLLGLVSGLVLLFGHRTIDQETIGWFLIIVTAALYLITFFVTFYLPPTNEEQIKTLEQELRDREADLERRIINLREDP